MKLEKFFYINSIQKYNYDYIKKTKAKLILRDKKINNIRNYLTIKKECFKRRIPLYIANNIKLFFKLKLKGIYISAYNKQQMNHLKNLSNKIEIIGSAHNLKEIIEKKKQGCNKIILSRIFKTYKKNHMGVIRFNLLSNISNKIICLGGINSNTFKKVKMINCVGVALKSDHMNKPKYLI